MSKNKITASEMLAKFKGASPAVGAMYSRVLANRHKAPPTVFQERKPAVFSPAMLNHERPSLPAAPNLQTYKPIGRHVLAQCKNFRDSDEALDVLMSFRAGMAEYHNASDRRSADWVKGRGLTPFNIGTTASPTGGGYLVPTPITAAIIEKRARVGVARQLAYVTPMESMQQTLPIETSGLTVYYTPETESLTASDFVFGSLGLSAEKRTVFAKASSELADDAIIVWLDRFISRAGYTLANTEDLEFISGDGTSTYGGEVGLKASLGSAGVSTAATGHDTWPELDVDDFAACMAKLPSDYANGSEAWICSPQFYAVGMLGAVGGVYQGTDQDGRPMFLDKPVYLTPKMPTSSAASTVCAFYGSFDQAAVIGDRGISYATSDKMPGAFEANLTVYRAVSRYDINVFGGGNASTAGAYVGLSTAS